MADSVFFEKPALCVVSLLYLFSLVLKCDYKGVYARTLENLCWLLWLDIIYMTLVQECKKLCSPNIARPLFPLLHRQHRRLQRLGFCLYFP